MERPTLRSIQAQRVNYHRGQVDVHMGITPFGSQRHQNPHGGDLETAFNMFHLASQRLRQHVSAANRRPQRDTSGGLRRSHALRRPHGLTRRNRGRSESSGLPESAMSDSEEPVLDEEMRLMLLTFDAIGLEHDNQIQACEQGYSSQDTIPVSSTTPELAAGSNTPGARSETPARSSVASSGFSYGASTASGAVTSTAIMGHMTTATSAIRINVHKTRPERRDDSHSSPKTTNLTRASHYAGNRPMAHSSYHVVGAHERREVSVEDESFLEGLHRPRRPLPAIPVPEDSPHHQ